MIIFELIGEMFDKLLTWFYIWLFVIVPLAFVLSYCLDIIKAFPTFFTLVGIFLLYKVFVFIKNA